MTILLDEDKEMGFTLVRSARAYIKESAVNDTSHRKVLATTRNAYIRTTDRLLKMNVTPLDHANTKKTFYAYRAAWIYTHAKEMEAVIKRADYHYKRKQSSAWLQQMDYLEILLGRVEDYPPDPHLQKQKTQKRGLWAKSGKKNTLAAIRARSRKATVKFLPARWRESIFSCASEQYQPIIAVLGLTGCRPEEFERGIKVEAAPGLSSLTFTIQGAKTHGGQYGQQWRKLTIYQDSDIFKFMAIQTVFAGGTLVVTGNAHAISESVSRLGKKMQDILGAEHRVSAYSFRHAMKADLRADGFSAGNVAQALGHCSAKTQRYYANPCKGSGGSGIISVEAEKSVEEPVYTHGYNNEADNISLNPYTHHRASS